MKNVVKFYISKLNISGYKQMILDNMNNRNADENVVYIIPDKFALNAERIFFDTTKFKSTFNMEFMTLTRLSNKVIKELNYPCNLIDKQVGSMLVFKIIVQNKDKLKTFSKVYNKVGFVEMVYNTINQFRSSMVSPQDLSQKQEFLFGALKLKMEDLVFVYKKYLEILENSYHDANSRMDLFTNLIKQSEYIKNTTFNFAMFDNFTFQQLETIKELLKYAKGVNFSLIYNVVDENKRIYINELYQKVKDVVERENLTIEKIYVKEDLTKEQEFVLKNLFAYNGKSLNTTVQNVPYSLVEARSNRDEVEYCAKCIKLDLFDGLQPKEINVALCQDSSYNELVREIFSKYSLPFYLEEELLLSSHFSAKFITKAIDVVQKNFSQSSVLSLLKFNVINFEYDVKDAFENYVLKNNVKYNSFLKPFENLQDDQIVLEELRKTLISPLVGLKEDFSKSKTVLEFTNAMESYLNKIKFFERLQELKQDLVDTNALEFRKMEQAEQKLKQCFDIMKLYLTDEEFEVNSFIELLENTFDNQNIKLVPVGANEIFISNISSSTFYPAKKMYFLGCTITSFPNSKSDCGIITDEELSLLTCKNAIEPTIKDINKREKFKCFQLLFNSNFTILSYPTQSDDGLGVKSEILEQISKILTINNRKLPILKTSVEIDQISQVKDKEIQQRLLKRFIASDNNLLKSQKEFDIEHRNITLPITNPIKENFSNQIQNAEMLFLAGKNMSVSKVENYANCPYNFFLNNGLKLKEREVAEIKPLDVGNILHKIAELFVKQLKDVREENIKEIVSKIFKSVQEDSGFKIIFDSLDSFRINSIKDEANRFCEAIFYQIYNGEFKVLKPEYRIQTVLQGINFKGFVDRIDEFEDYIRIIDYKTGSEKFDFAQLYYGLKIQLFLYAKLISQELNKKVAGCFYMPVKNSFSKTSATKFENYKLDGVFDESIEILKAMDKNVNFDEYKSDIVSLSIKKGEVSRYSTPKMLSNVEFNDLLNYAENIFISNINNIKQGKIDCLPYKKTAGSTECSCQWCKFKTICRYDYKQQGARLLDAKLDKTLKEKGEANE